MPLFSKTRLVFLGRYTPLFLFALNLLIGWRFLNTEFTGYFASIEPFFYTIADHIRAHPFDGGWMHEWNCGIPFRTSYQPLLHYLVAGWGALTGWSSARAFHFVFAILYSAGPVTLFLLVRRLARSYGTALMAALLYSLWSPSAWLIPVIARDIDGLLHARRLQTAAAYGNSPYVVALTFLPLAVLMVDRVVERWSVGRVLAAALAVVAVPLVNIPGAISMAMAMVAYCLAAERKLQLRRAGAVAVAGALGFLLAAPFLPPSSLLLTARNTQWMDESGHMTAAKLGLVAVAAVLLGGTAFLLPRVRAGEALRFGVLFTLLTGAVVMGREWGGVSVIAQPDRFHLVMEMAIVIALAGMGAAVAKKARWREPWPKRILIVAAAAAGWQIGEYRLYARHVILRASVEKRSEYKVARWMDQHAAGNRVMVPGSVSFAMNAWTATPQVGGCCDQNVLFAAPRIAKYVLGTDDGAGNRMAEISLAWLQTLGVRYVALCGPRSDETYRETHHSHKFDGVLRRVWQDGDDAIFEVPGQTESLAHWVGAGEVIRQFPVNGVEISPLTAYVRAVSDVARPRASFRWLDNSRARIEGVPRPGEVLSVQVPYHPGWTAHDGKGRAVPLEKDGLGFLLLKPQCSAECALTLEFSGGREAQILAACCALTWAGFLMVAVWRRITLGKVKLA